MNEAYDQVLKKLKTGAIPIRNLMDHSSGLHPDFEKVFKDADVIYGYNTAAKDSPINEAMTVFYGRGFFQDVVHTQQPAPARLIAVAYDQTTTELEMLVACCQAHRGACDYERSSGFHRKDREQRRKDRKTRRNRKKHR